MLPRNTLLTQLTGITESALYAFACFYRGNLLLAPDALSLSAYIEAVESGDVLDGTPMYEEGIGSLSPIYNFVMMADMEMMLSQPETYVRYRTFSSANPTSFVTSCLQYSSLVQKEWFIRI